MTEIMDAPAAEPAIAAQTRAPASEPSGWMSPEGEIREGAPENIRTLLEKKKWTNINQVVDNYTELEKKAYSQQVVVPGEDDVEGRNSIYAQLGRPDTFDKYEVTNESGIDLSEELTGQFKQFAHGLGLNQKQFSDIVGFQLDAVKGQATAYEAQQAQVRETNVQAMKDKWQTQYDPTIQRVDAMAEKLGVAEYFKGLGIDREPEVVNMLLTLSNSDKEDSLTSQKAPSRPSKTPYEELTDIKKSDSFMDKFHPEHKQTMTRYMDLNQQIANAGQGRAPRS